MTFTFAASDHVRHTVADGILRVTIDRPEKRNPLSLGVLDSLRRIFTEAAADESLSLAVLTGAGDRAFASGGDLAELAAYRTEAEAEAFSRHGKAALEAIRAFPVPVIARVNGVALGGGCELALACDLRLAAAHARIGLIHGQLAIAPSWGGGIDLARLLGPARALRHLLDAQALAGPAALEAGLVDGVCPQGEDFDAWFEAAIAQWRRPPQVTRAMKGVTGSRDGDRAAHESRDCAAFARAWAHDDHWQAVERLKA
jgi:enoyl-CoA hydratase